MHRLREHRTPSAGDGVVMSPVALRVLRIPSPEFRDWGGWEDLGPEPVGHDDSAEFKMRLYDLRPGRQLRCLRQPFQVRVDHHGDQSLEIYRRLPSKLPLRF